MKEIVKRDRVCNKRIFAAGLVCMLLFSGCGTSDKDRLKEALSNVDTDISSSTDADETVSDVQDQLIYTLTSASGDNKINVDAKVTADGYGNLSVYAETPIIIDDKYLNNLAENIFDDGKYEIVKPYEICSLEELEREDQLLRELYEAEGVEYSFWDIAYYIENYNEKNVQELPQGTVIFHSEDDVEGETISTDSGTLRGYVDGVPFELRYYADDSNGYKYSSLILSRVVPHGRLYTSCSTEYELAHTLYGENACDLDSSMHTAQDLMERMGYTDMSLIATEYLVLNEDTSDGVYMDGYNFTFVRETDGIQHLLYNQTYAVVKDTYEVEAMLDTLPGAVQEWISISVDSSGIRGISFSIRYDRGERLSEHISTLSFAQVDAVAQDYMNHVLDAYDAYGAWAEINIVEVRFGYVVLLYDDQYTLVPVWMYVDEKSFEYSAFSNGYFAVNALDGSIVQFCYSGETLPLGAWH